MKRKRKTYKKLKIEFVDGTEDEPMFDDCLACLDPKGELNLIERLKGAHIRKNRVIN